jgi:putative flippase GtrA
MDAPQIRTSTAIQFAKFLAVGVLNTAFGYGVFALLIFAGVRPMPSLAITYVVGVTFNFVTTGQFVFDHFHRSALLRFIAAYVVVFLINAALYEILSASGVTPLVAQAICLPIMAILAFFLFKFHVFNPHIRRV